MSTFDWGDSEKQDRGRLGELRFRSKTKAGPLEGKPLSRLGNIALTCQVRIRITALHWRTLRSDTQTESTMFNLSHNFNVLSVRWHIRILPDMPQLQLQLHHSPKCSSAEWSVGECVITGKAMTSSSCPANFKFTPEGGSSPKRTGTTLNLHYKSNRNCYIKHWASPTSPFQAISSASSAVLRPVSATKRRRRIRSSRCHSRRCHRCEKHISCAPSHPSLSSSLSAPRLVSRPASAAIAGVSQPRLPARLAPPPTPLSSPPRTSLLQRRYLCPVQVARARVQAA